ncbi:GmrSD restriction endonuclease domain-containing protein [Stenotrophomonas geniculata]|uniref:GmrSD restriction endonuclease domain-containing protein n=1 Tax=Stenotrophomonas geniculata TaxID=86188 RepID=UPI0013DD3C17|nr:DUF262 domain-containing protein [Stenotrophomonas geniculata]
MANRANLVNLDAMIIREDFAVKSSQTPAHYDKQDKISVRDFAADGLLGSLLRKPDFQRETNHWTPEQVVSLLECYVDGDLIPSVILWQSETATFVIDGGHRLSVLRAWVEDDYGDGHLSLSYFGTELSKEQKRVASRTRQLVESRIGRWSTLQKKAKDSLAEDEKKRLNIISTRALPIQWVNGDVDKAEASFFKINTKGTPLDNIEELLLKNRHKPIAIAARAIIRSGKGHKYWSAFDNEVAEKIEESAKKINELLFDPELQSPIKTLDLPLGGSRGMRTAIQTLIDLCIIANRDQSGQPRTLSDTSDDSNGSGTLKALQRTRALVERVTGNSAGSLGLHPAVYFYGPSGRHSSYMFMGAMQLIAQKAANNDSNFFKKFTSVRQELERVLIEKKDLLSTIIQRHISVRRASVYAEILDYTIQQLRDKHSPTDSDLVSIANLEGKIVVGTPVTTSIDFSDDVKSQTFITSAISSAQCCTICGGYLDPTKSVSYDHAKDKKHGGKGNLSNCNMTHPYCNTAYKNCNESPK